jgi:hypothetical protein
MICHKVYELLMSILIIINLEPCAGKCPAAPAHDCQDIFNKIYSQEISYTLQEIFDLMNSPA